MSWKKADDTPSLTKEALELLRTRELYKYFEPLSTPSDDGGEESDRRPTSSPSSRSTSPGSDEDGLRSLHGDRPLSTRDPVLGSLILLAERLLHADRVIVIFADAFREYLVADSGQALSHFTGKAGSTEGAPHPGSWKKRSRNRDDLFSIFIHSPVDAADAWPRTVADDDLPANDKWRHEWPHVRRYAGVPIRTRAGSVIGALCALYKQPRRALSPLQGCDGDSYNDTFRKLAAAVLRYMEVVRGEREMKRGRKMEVALSRFIAGNFSPDKVALTAPSEGTLRVETSHQESARLDGERAETSKERGQKELERWRGRKAGRRAAGLHDDDDDDDDDNDDGDDGGDDDGSSSHAGSPVPTSLAPTQAPPSTQASSVTGGCSEPGSTPASVSASASISASDGPSYFDSRPSPRGRHSRSRSPPPPSLPPAFAGHYGQPFKHPDRSPPLPASKRKRKARRGTSPWSGFHAAYLSREPHKPYFLPAPDGSSSCSGGGGGGGGGGGCGGSASTGTSEVSGLGIDGPQTPGKKTSVAGSEAASVNSLPVNVAAAQHALFMRASDLMRRAMDVDGIVFVNYDLEGLSDLDLPAPPPPPAPPSPLNHTSSDQHHSEAVRAKRAQNSRARSGILGFSGIRAATARSADHASIIEAVGADASALSESYLHTLCESWPRGCIFAYSRNPSHPVLGITVNPDGSDGSDDGQLHETDNVEIVDVLRRFLPGSKSVMFVPLYDFVGKVFAVGFAWRSSSVRVFRGDVEGGFMAAFCDSIMQEISRIQVVSANVAKGNFISTISHELRSPLHGILASCELFRESVLSDYERDLVGTITSCGRTLLDTVNNVLTFTKLNTKANARKDRRKRGNIAGLNQDLISHQLDAVSEPPLVGIDLGELVEEVVEASYIGFRFDPDPKQEHCRPTEPAGDTDRIGRDVAATAPAELPTKEHVHFTLAIDPEISQRRFKVPPGAFRRLVLNLCTNALKYTDFGWVRVWLALHEQGGGPDKHNLTLTVADSGRGISREFLKNSLFTPFMQEFPMHSGTGLGMSIVRQLVDELGGTVDVRSQVGVGTEVTVGLKLESTPVGGDTQAQQLHSDNVIWKARALLPGKSVSLVGLDYGPRSTATREALRGLESYLCSLLTETFGMTVQRSPLRSVTTDCAIVHGGKELAKYLEEIGASKQKPPVPLIELGGGRVGVSSNSLPSVPRHRQQQPEEETHGNLVVYLSRPYCPRKVAAALLYALQRQSQPQPQPHPQSQPQPQQRPQPQPQQERPQTMTGYFDLQPGLSPPPTLALPRAKQRPSSQDGVTDNHLPTVLLVEDNVINMKLLATFFRKSGYSFEQAANGLEALQAVQQRPEGFDVIFMDLQMPVMSGTDSTRAIRELETERGAQRCCIIALTALSGEEAKLEAYRAGVDLFLVKPVKMGELRTILMGKKRADDGF